MLDESAFLKAIAEDGDDAARLAFADWLEERGDPRAAWVRDPDVFPWMLPDGRDPLPALIAALSDQPWRRSDRINAALRRLGAYAVPALMQQLERGEEVASHYAARALQIMGPEAVAPLVPRLAHLIRTNPELYDYAATAISGAGPAAAEVVPELIARLVESRNYDGPDNVTLDALGAIGPAAIAAVPQMVWQLPLRDHHAGDALARLGPAAARPLLREAGRLDSDWLVEAVYPLRCYGEAAVDDLRAALSDDNDFVRYLAAMALAPLDGEAAAPVLLGLLGEQHRGEFHGSVLESLGLAAASAPSLIPRIREALLACDPSYAPHWDADLIEQIIAGLDRTPEERVVEDLSRGQWWQQRNALLALGDQRPPAAVLAAVRPLAQSYEPEVRRLAQDVLARADQP